MPSEFEKTRDGHTLKPGMRVRLYGFTGAYVPPEPTGTIHGFDGHWWGIILDPHVRFKKKDGGNIPPRPYYGFNAGAFKVIDPLPYQLASREWVKMWVDKTG